MNNTTFKSWGKGRPTASFRDFYTIKVISRKQIVKESFVKSICTIKILQSSSCPYVFSTIKDYINESHEKIVTGVSHLHKGDEHNALTGQDIAEHKAMCKAYNYIAKQFEKAEQIYNKLAKDCSNFHINYKDRAIKQEKCWHKLGRVE